MRSPENADLFTLDADVNTLHTATPGFSGDIPSSPDMYTVIGATTPGRSVAALYNGRGESCSKRSGNEPGLQGWAHLGLSLFLAFGDKPKGHVEQFAERRCHAG